MQSNQDSDNGGLRDDEGKPEFHLIPSDALRELGRVFTFGAKKYEPYNWERGMAWSRCYNSLLRHLYAYWAGEQIDPETKLHHMAHCAWNALALLVYSIRGIGVDDRKTSQGKRSVREIMESLRTQPNNEAGGITEITRENLAASKSELPQRVTACPSVFSSKSLEGTKADDDRLSEIDRPQPVGSMAEIKEGLKFKAYGSQVVWTISRLIMSSLNTFQAKDEFGNEQMFHLRAIVEIVP